MIGFASGGSESFVIVPAPATGLLGLLGLGTAGVTLRRRGVSGRRAA
ncbi:PEP-CTERM sorting domain-containing protein [Anaerobaca lacustris]